jgi:hypothetical protein
MKMDDNAINRKLAMLDIDPKNLKEAREMVDNIKKLHPRSNVSFRHPWIKLHVRSDISQSIPSQDEILKIFKKTFSTYAILPVTDEMCN